MPTPLGPKTPDLKAAYEKAFGPVDWTQVKTSPIYSGPLDEDPDLAILGTIPLTRGD